MTGTGSRCPKCGAASVDPEFCDQCGAAMTPSAASARSADAAPAAAAAVPAAAPGTPDACPVCCEARPGPLARFCDNCRYDFLEKRAFAAPAPAPVSVPAPSDAPVTPPPAAAHASAVLQRWDLHASVDVSLRRPEDPMPTDLRARIFPLDLADHLIGRRSDSEDIHPEIIIGDPGISRRHARILRAPDGALTALDLGSMNGTRLNGAPLEPNVATPLADGDALTLGCWTRLTVKAR